ncbi:hypothetical protein HYV10_01070 [Candidatus Dependentiae bacterium]|nr:hypothetical protein [Candidatus Dependentiae bacterium]
MKHSSVFCKRIHYISLAIIFTCWNGSIVDSSKDKEKRPDINFYGELTDHYTTSKVEDILIAGKYEQIPFYSPIKIEQKSSDENKKNIEIDPKQNRVLIDLQEVSVIELKHPSQPIKHEITINNKKYVEVTIINITGSKNDYIIESNREISCKKIDKGPDGNQKPVFEERKLNMIHLKKLLISGYKSNQDKAKSSSRDSSLSEKSEISMGTEKILDQIEEKVNNLPKEDPSNYEKIKDSLLSLLKSLRNQLQKLLDMIKS